MFSLFKVDKREKESKFAKTPEPTKTAVEELTKVKVFFFIWNIISITIFSAYTLFVIYKLSINTFLSKVIVWLLGIYAAAFVILILINIGNRKRLKLQLKNYKSATKFLKYAIQILNFSLAIITAISAFISTGSADFSSMLWAGLSILITVVAIFFEVIKIIIRRNISAIKQNFLDIREKPRKRKDDLYSLDLDKQKEEN